MLSNSGILKVMSSFEITDNQVFLKENKDGRIILLLLFTSEKTNPGLGRGTGVKVSFKNQSIDLVFLKSQ
jgi:hypothetical protein